MRCPRLAEAFADADGDLSLSQKLTRGTSGSLHPHEGILSVSSFVLFNHNHNKGSGVKGPPLLELRVLKAYPLPCQVQRNLNHYTPFLRYLSCTSPVFLNHLLSSKISTEASILTHHQPSPINTSSFSSLLTPNSSLLYTLTLNKHALSPELRRSPVVLI